MQADEQLFPHAPTGISRCLSPIYLLGDSGRGMCCEILCVGLLVAMGVGMTMVMIYVVTFA